jgi:RHS repeat-associated protein
MGRTTTSTLDDRGRQTDVVAAGLPAVHFEYDESGRVAEVTFTADGEVRRQVNTYGANGFLASREDARGSVTELETDLVGRIGRLLRADGEETTAAYDRNDNLTSLLVPGGGTHAFRYIDGTDLLELTTPPAMDIDSGTDLPTGAELNVYDDGEGRDRALSSVQRSDGQNIDFSYDEVSGRLKSTTIPQATISYGYDAGGRIASVNRSDSVKVVMTHDGPLWTGTTWSGAVDGSVKATYDENRFLASLTVNGASTARFSYDDDGLMLSATANNVVMELERDADTGFVTDTTLGIVTTASDYNGFGEPSRLRAAFQGDVNFTELLERDELGRIVGITETIGGTTREIEYAYDATGRLGKETVDGSETEYAYDANGNRISVTVDGETVEAQYDAQDRLVRFDDSEAEQTPQGDLLRIGDGENADELVYDPLGNLMSVTQLRPDRTRVVSYVVDGLGRRVARRIDGNFESAWFYRDALRPVGQIDDEGVFMHFIYTDKGVGGAPDFILRAGVPYRVIKDHLGSVRLVINAQTGIVEQKLDYDAFGRVIGDTSPGFQPFGFAGGLDDPYTGLVRFGKRDYSPTLGRWMAKDPSGFGGGDTNLYRYCFGDPVNRVDPDGQRPLSAKERAFLLQYFGSSIDMDSIDVDVLPEALKLFGVKGMNPYGSKVLLPAEYFDGSDPSKDVSFKGFKARTALAHEVFHVWQRSHGTALNVTVDGMALGVGRLFGISPYAYEASLDPHEMYLRFLMGGVEQQAAMFEHYVLSDIRHNKQDRKRKASLAEIAAHVLSP